MALNNGIDTVSFVSGGVYSETYGAGNPRNLATLFVSYGMIEGISLAVGVRHMLIDFIKPIHLFNRITRKLFL